METKINGKAIYSPKGKAGEYAKYAVNFYVGCDNNCDYCYCKKGILKHAIGAPKATLKKCFKDETHAFEVFRKEVKANLEALREHGLFFTFTSDPMLENTRELTINAVGHAISFGIPCKILTKRADFIDYLPGEWLIQEWYRSKIAFGFTLTGHDELEPGANTNAERIKAMSILSFHGFKTFASIEPIIHPEISYKMIDEALPYCNLFKIGLLSGKKSYDSDDIKIFMVKVCLLFKTYGANTQREIPKLYFKESMYEYSHYKREGFEKDLDFIVQSDYNLFK